MKDVKGLKGMKGNFGERCDIESLSETYGID